MSFAGAGRSELQAGAAGAPTSGAGGRAGCSGGVVPAAPGRREQPVNGTP